MTCLIASGAGVLVVAAVALWVARLYGKIATAEKAAAAARAKRVAETARADAVEAQLDKTSREFAEYRSRTKAKEAADKRDLDKLRRELAKCATGPEIDDQIESLMSRRQG